MAIDMRISLAASSQPLALDDERFFSRLLGTKRVPPPEQVHAGVWPFDEREEHYPEFVIGEDENGQQVRHSCNPGDLADSFGGNAGMPSYLTPVFFRREVLLKYYEDPDHFTVSDGYLSCAGLWGVQIDNDRTEFVSVFLGDLGRDLPESERSHWKSHNIAPESGISLTSFQRSFLNISVNPTAPDLVFKHRLNVFRRHWSDALAWDLLRQPPAVDRHVMKSLRIPLNGSHSEFEGQILNLSKLLVDALNDSELSQRLASRVPNEKSIAKFRRWLAQEGYSHSEDDAKFLQKIQSLRSRGAAHLKGSDYEQFLEDQLGTLDLVQGFSQLLNESTELLERLESYFLPEGS